MAQKFGLDWKDGDFTRMHGFQQIMAWEVERNARESGGSKKQGKKRFR